MGGKKKPAGDKEKAKKEGDEEDFKELICHQMS